MPPARRSSPEQSLAGAAGERVRAIIEAAEASAAAIRAEAEAEAERIRAGAEERASVLRSEARGDVQALVGSIREAVDRLGADLDRLEQRLAEPGPEAARSSAPAAGTAATSPTPAPPEEDPEVALAEDAAAGPNEDVEGARLVALNMALDGASRDQVHRELRDKHGVKNPAPLLDEVFASIG